MITLCRSCRAPIRWVRTVNRRRLMPLDAAPNPAGNVELVDGRAVVHHQPPLVPPAETWMPHWATCPDAGEWRT